MNQIISSITRAIRPTGRRVIAETIDGYETLRFASTVYCDRSLPMGDLDVLSEAAKALSGIAHLHRGEARLGEIAGSLQGMLDRIAKGQLRLVDVQ